MASRSICALGIALRTTAIIQQHKQALLGPIAGCACRGARTKNYTGEYVSLGFVGTLRLRSKTGQMGDPK
jgi:hypothetical protein